MSTLLTQEEIYDDISKNIFSMYSKNMISEDIKESIKEVSKQYYTFYSELNHLMDDKTYIFDNNSNNPSEDVMIGCNKIGYINDKKLSLNFKFVAKHGMKGNIRFINDKLTVNFETHYNSHLTEILKKYVWMKLYKLIYDNKEKTDSIMEKNTIILNTARILKTFSIDSKLIKPHYIKNINKNSMNSVMPVRYSSLDFYNEYLKLKDIVLLASDINIEKDLERLKQLINIKNENRLSND